jgi:hypothetical protein
VEQPDARIVRHEADAQIPAGPHRHHVAHHRHGRDGGRRRVLDEVAGVLVGAGHELEVVPVQVEGVLAHIVVVEDDLDYLPALEDLGVGVDAVDGRVGCRLAEGEGGEERGDLGGDVGDVVERAAASGQFGFRRGNCRTH